MTVAYILDTIRTCGPPVFHVLANVGYEVHDFSSSEPMLARLAAAPPDILVLDLALGQSDAIEVMRRLAALKYSGKCCSFSGHDETLLGEVQRIGERHQLAMLASLCKPFRAKHLLGRLTASPMSWVRSHQHEQLHRPPVSLAQALAAGWLELWYQPKIDLRSFHRVRGRSLAARPASGIRDGVSGRTAADAWRPDAWAVVLGS
jgi:DNA-binding response OmpR family regulator